MAAKRDWGDWPRRGREFLHATLKDEDGNPARCRVMNRRLSFVHYRTLAEVEDPGKTRKTPLDSFQQEVAQWLT